MNSLEFGKVLEDQIKRTIEILGSKAGEYATDDERLHNFKVIAEMQNITLHLAVVNLMAKHTVSIFDLARAPKATSKEMWDEKITDHINYLILLQAALAEERKSMAQENSFPNEDLVTEIPRTILTPIDQEVNIR